MLHIDAKIVMSSDARILSMVRQAIRNLTLEIGWNDADSNAITLAVEEALTNKIRHAYGNRPDGRIQFDFRIERGALVFELTDQGKAPDPRRICAREAGSLTPGGLGTHIMRDVMDEVAYQTNNSGNLVILTKFLPGTHAAELSK
jgi:anti-sigma regulatory factor (Ser/Thr protein kinase)